MLIIDPADSFGGAEQYALTIGKVAITAGRAVEAAINTETLRLFR